MPEKALQLLDPVNDGQHHPASALAGEPGRPQFGDLVEEPPAQRLLYPASILVGDDRAGVVQKRAQQHRRADPGRQDRDDADTRATEDPREQHA